MFEKIGRAAEKVATGVGTSRRGFLGQLGRAAVVAAVAAGGVLASAGRVSAVHPCHCCSSPYGCAPGDAACVTRCAVVCLSLKRCN